MYQRSVFPLLKYAAHIIFKQPLLLAVLHEPYIFSSLTLADGYKVYDLALATTWHIFNLATRQRYRLTISRNLY